MKRVFHVISHFDLGGAERIAANIAKSGNADFEYHVVEILRGSSPFTTRFIAELEQAGVRCHRSLMPDFRFHFMAERMAAVLFPLRFLLIWLRFHPDVIHAHTETPDMCLWAFFRVFPWLKKRCRIVRTIHNTCLWTGLKHFGKVVENFYQHSNANVAISQSVRQSYTEEYGTTPPVIYNGVDKVEQKHFETIVPGKINILFAGRFDEQKGISHLIYIVKKLKEVPLYYFHVAGDGRLRQIVERELGSLPNVSLYPPVFGISAYLGSFHYMLMPSEFEGLGLMAVEAAFASLPVICNDCRGLNEAVPKEWPLAVHANSHEQYMNIFRNILPTVNRCILAKAAKDFVSERFSIKTMQRQYEDFYLS